ncbi:hypothetical protein GCM10011513_21500 [Franconibacter daqui]|nr:hypothetical protein GCM10011513_21500 [Franconibacter daqui]
MTATEAHISVSGTATPHTTSSRVFTDSVMPELNQWQQHSRERVCSFVRLDAIHSKIHEDGRYQSKVAYTLQVLNLEGKKKFQACIYIKAKGRTSGCRY